MRTTLSRKYCVDCGAQLKRKRRNESMCDDCAPKNLHIVVGGTRSCLCGTYQGKSASCLAIIEALDRMRECSLDEVIPLAADVQLLSMVIGPMIQDCK